MFMAFVGLIDDEFTELCIRGNGKTCSMTYYLFWYKTRGKQIWTNYYTTFSDKVIGFQEMINTLKQMKENKEKINVVLGVTEMQELINSVGSKTEQLLFVDSFTSQMRKLNCDCLYDTQILKNINIRLRRHTENIRIPMKRHLNEDLCNFDRCTKKHYIDIYTYKPVFNKYPIKRIKAWQVGKLYNTMDTVIDKLIIDKLIIEKEIKEHGIKPSN